MIIKKPRMDEQVHNRIENSLMVDFFFVELVNVLLLVYFFSLFIDVYSTFCLIILQYEFHT